MIGHSRVGRSPCSVSSSPPRIKGVPPDLRSLPSSFTLKHFLRKYTMPPSQQTSRFNARGFSSQKKYSTPVVAPLPKPLSSQKLLDTIDSAPAHVAGVCRVENLEHVASFNWVNHERSTILVPGRFSDNRLQSMARMLGSTARDPQDIDMSATQASLHDGALRRRVTSFTKTPTSTTAIRTVRDIPHILQNQPFEPFWPRIRHSSSVM